MKSIQPVSPAQDSPSSGNERTLSGFKARTFDHAAIGMALLDTRGRWLDVNDEFCRMLGMDRACLLRLSFEVLTVEEDLDISRRQMARLLGGETESCHFEKRYRRADGGVVWVHIHAWKLRGHGDEDDFIVTQARDITTERATREALAESEARLALALEGADLGMWHWNCQSGGFEFSASAARLLGHEEPPADVTLEALRELFHPKDQPGISESMRRHLEGEARSFDRVMRLRHHSGDYIWVLVRGRVVHRDAAKRPVKVSGTLMDVTKWKNLESRLRSLATTDELTGLLNRRAGVATLNKALENSSQVEQPLSMVLLDIDRFKQINDKLGHDVGDQVLRVLGRYLNENRRASDHAIRWGGEEFAVILPLTDRVGAKAQAQRLFDGIAGLVDQVEEINALSASIGVVTRHGDESAREMMNRADALMYEAKNAGRACIRSD